MRTRVCTVCKKVFAPPENGSRICSDECRMVSAKGRNIRAVARAARRRDQTRLDKGKVSLRASFDRYDIAIGQKILIDGEIATVLDRVLPGTSISDSWEEVLGRHPELYEAQAGIAPRGIVSSLRYIIAIVRPAGTYVKWPYLYSIQGVLDESEAEDSEKAKAKEKPLKPAKGKDPVVKKLEKDKARSMPMGARCFLRPELESIFLGIAEAGKVDGQSISPAAYEAVQSKLDEIFGLVPATLGSADAENPHEEKEDV